MSARISRVGLGTVQFGIPYGINNTSGQVALPEVVRILEMAATHDITFLDTARGYGDSEDVLGKALDIAGLRDTFSICTKVDLPAGYAEMTRDQLRRETQISIDTSRRLLGCDQLEIVLLHHPEYRWIEDGVVWDVLLGEVTRGNIGSLGVSAARGPGDLEGFLQEPLSSIVQIPFNPIDGRWEQSDVFASPARPFRSVINRSTFLQGLLLMTREDVLRRLPTASAVHATWLDTCREIGMAPMELALRFALAEPNIDCTLIGVDSVEQLEQDIRCIAQPLLEIEVISNVKNRCNVFDTTIVNPLNWPTESKK